MDLFDEIFTKQDEEKSTDEDNIDDLYSNIHDVQVAETIAQNLKTLSAEHEKIQKQNATLKSQVSILKNLNFELTEKNKNLSCNIKELIETARNEINRKNDQIKNLRAELDNILFKRAARNINSKELNEILLKHKLPEEPFAKLPTQFLAKQKEKNSSLLASVSGSLIKSPTSSPGIFKDGNIGNRQFVKQKRKLESPSTNELEPQPSKKLKQDFENIEPKKGQASEVPLASKTGINMDISLISRYVKERRPKPKVERPSSSNKSVEKESHEDEGPVKKNELKPTKKVEEDSEQSSRRAKSRHRSSDSKSQAKSQSNTSTSSDRKKSNNPKGKDIKQDCQEEKQKFSKEKESSAKQTLDKSIPIKQSKIQEIKISGEKVTDVDQKEKAESQPNDLDDLLEIGNSETFDDLDYEPEENQAGETVLFKSMTSKFSIPKTCKSDITRTEIKDNYKEERRNEKHSKGEFKNNKNITQTDKSKSRDSDRHRKKSRTPDRDSGERDRGKRKNGSGERERRRSRSRRRRGERSPGKRRSGSRERTRRPERRRRSGSRRRRGSPSERSSRNRVTRSRARRSQSLSPARLKDSEKELDINKIEIEDDMSLDALEVIKIKLMGKMGLDEKLEPVNAEDIEEGEVTDSEDEEAKDKPEEKKKSAQKSEERTKGISRSIPREEKTVNIKDLREKLKQVERNQDTAEEKIISPVKKVPDVSTKIKAVLQDYSSDEIEQKLIPLKKRQFNELQMEEKQLRVKIASRSKSNTPRRDSECSDVMMKSSPPLVIASPIIEQDEEDSTEVEDNEVFDDKRVSPLKLSLRGIEVRATSSSCSNECDTKDGLSGRGQDGKIQELVTNPDSEHRLQDDNAMDTQLPPVTPVKRGAVLDISNDLILTDDSDIEISPVKLKSRAAAAAAKRKKEQLSFSVLKQLPLTPKENMAQNKVDVTSPQGISSLLKSPMVSGTLLATSTPVNHKTLENQSPEKAIENTSVPADLAKNVKRKRFARSGVKLN